MSNAHLHRKAYILSRLGDKEALAILRTLSVKLEIGVIQWLGAK